MSIREDLTKVIGSNYVFRGQMATCTSPEQVITLGGVVVGAVLGVVMARATMAPCIQAQPLTRSPYLQLGCHHTLLDSSSSCYCF